MNIIACVFQNSVAINWSADGCVFVCLGWVSFFAVYSADIQVDLGVSGVSKSNNC